MFSFAITGSGGDELTNPSGLAVDNSGGSSADDIYVADPKHFRVEKFSSGGSFLLMFGRAVNKTKLEQNKTEVEQNLCDAGETCQSGTYGDMPGSVGEPSWLAVDSSDGPSAGDVYVADNTHSLISKFTPTGRLLSTWQANGQLAINGGIRGVTVDRAGNLWVRQADDGSILEFNESGSLVSNFETSVGGLGIALDSTNSIYLATEQGRVEKYTGSGEDLGSLEAGTPAGLAIDPSTDAVYVDEASPDEIKEFSANCRFPNCDPIASFGEGHLSSAAYQDRGIAADASDGTLYVSNPSVTGGEGVAVFLPPGVLPEVTTGPSRPGQPNLVTGNVDPLGTGIVTGCGFEFVDYSEDPYGRYTAAKSASCTPAPPYPAATEVRAELPNVAPNTAYAYRLVASNAQGRATGTSEKFTSLGTPEAFTESTSSVRGGSAVVAGTIRAPFGEALIGCSFEYGDQSVYAATGYADAMSVPCSPGPPYGPIASVSAAITGLSPGTTYHYRVTGSNAERSGVGADAEFTTSDQPEGEGAPEEGPKPHAQSHRPVRCSKRACSRRLVATATVKRWRSPKFPLNAGTLFGLYVKGHSVHLSDLAEHCVGTFSTRGLLATLDECSGRFRLIYLGSEPFRIRWRVFP